MLPQFLLKGLHWASEPICLGRGGTVTRIDVLIGGVQCSDIHY